MFFAAKSVKRRLIMFGKIGVKAHPFMGPRMAKPKFASMKRLTMKAKTVPAARINIIAYERMIDICHMGNISWDILSININGNMIAKIIMQVVVVILNYVFSKLIIFKKKKNVEKN